MFPSPLINPLYIIAYSTLSDCLKMSPTGAVCLAVAPLQTAKNPGLRWVCRVTVSFYNQQEPKAAWKGNGGHRKADFGPGTWMRWSGAQCVTLRLASFVAGAEITAVYSCRNGQNAELAIFDSPQNHVKIHPHTRSVGPKASGSPCAQTPQAKLVITAVEMLLLTCNYIQ